MTAIHTERSTRGKTGTERVKSLCVFCGSQAGDSPSFAGAAERLGKVLAEKHVRLVYGGGGIGLMGIVARSALSHGGAAIGVVPRFLRAMEVQQDGLTELILTETMHERKWLMYDMSDAFAVLPGGIGTLEEVTELLSWRHLNVHAKPIVLVDIDGYWDPLIKLIDHTIARRFAHPNVAKDFTVVKRVEDILPAVGFAAPVPA